MRTFVSLVAVGTTVLGALATGASAQSPSSSASTTTFLQPPVLLAQPGIITVNPHNDFYREGSGFNLRLVGVVPTSIPAFQFLAGVQFAPNGTSTRANGTTTGNFYDNRPSVFYGVIVGIKPLGDVFNNWFSFSVDPQGVFGPGGYDKNHAYSNEFVLEGAVSFNFGRKMFAPTGWASGLALYGLIDQQISDAPLNANGNRNYWNPNILYGLTVPLSPFR
jgi:hypothetical protein